MADNASKTAEINDLKKSIQAAGKKVPNIEDMKLDDAIELLKGVLEEGTTKPQNPGVELKKEPTQPDMTAILASIQDLRRELTKKDEQIELLAKAVTERAVNAHPNASIIHDPGFQAILRQMANKDVNDKGLVRMEYANEDDRCKPVTFITTKLNQKLYHITIGGQHMAPPLNYPFVRFENLFWFKNQETGRVTYRGEFTTESIMMCDWIRKSHKFGVEIYDSMEEAAQLSQNSEWADLRDNHLAILRLSDDDAVSKRAYAFNLPFGKGTDMNKLRKQIAEKMADDDMAKAQEAKREFLKQRSADSILIKEHLGMSAAAATP